MSCGITPLTAALHSVDTGVKNGQLTLTGPVTPAALDRITTKSSSWLQVVSHLHPRYGGISAAVPELSSAVAEASGRRVTVAGFCQPEEQFRPALHQRVDVAYLPASRTAWLRSRAPEQQLQYLVQGACGVHVHGLWQQHSAVAAKTARANRVPYVVSAHGMLERWAMRNKGWKKRLYLALVERKALDGAACLHALTQAERDDYRRAGLRNPIAVIPNGVHVPPCQTADEFLARFPNLAGKRLLLFLGRIHFKKGLDILCRAWAQMAPSHPDAHLVLAGPDFEGTQARIEMLVDELGIRARTTFTGMLTGDLKWSALAASEGFVLPSYSEGLSVSVLEALGCGLPVVISEHCNLPEIAEHECGLVIPATAERLQGALTELLHLAADGRREMSRKGQALVASRFSWSSVGRQMHELYSWVERGAHKSMAPSGLALDFSRGER